MRTNHVASGSQQIVSPHRANVIAAITVLFIHGYVVARFFFLLKFVKTGRTPGSHDIHFLRLVSVTLRALI